VRLEWCGQTIDGVAEGVETHQGRLRASAEATLQAASAATANRARFEMVGVKAVRAFDGWVVIVRVNGNAGERAYRLLGSASCEDEARLSNTAALALLDATNRLLERYVQAP